MPSTEQQQNDVIATMQSAEQQQPVRNSQTCATTAIHIDVTEAFGVDVTDDDCMQFRQKIPPA